MISPDLVRRANDPATRAIALAELGRWVVETILLFGGQPHTAYNVAAAMVAGLTRELERKGGTRP